jgi:hypothetical protein
MKLSLNEVETTVTKAAQGRSIDYGIAAEIGVGARWLCARGFDGISEAVSALSFCGDPETAVTRLGLPAVDLAAATESPVRVVDCSSPLMLRALAAQVECAVYVDASTGKGNPAWVVDPDSSPDESEALETTALATPAWDQIVTWAALTYVPSSEHSRIAGAGAGLTDND